MTREEEIYNAMGDAEWKHIDGTKDIELFDMGFKEGAMWADTHPRWISVEDELPPKTGFYNVVLNGDAYSLWYYPNINEWAEIYADEAGYLQNRKMEGVTHWMPIPQPPSSSGIPNNHKKGECMEIFKLLERLESENAATCRGCKHRQRFELNEHSTKVVQCCDLQPSNRSNSGYKTIKVTDKACSFYEPKKGGEK